MAFVMGRGFDEGSDLPARAGQSKAGQGAAQFRGEGAAGTRGRIAEVGASAGAGWNALMSRERLREFVSVQR